MMFFIKFILKLCVHANACMCVCMCARAYECIHDTHEVRGQP